MLKTTLNIRNKTRTKLNFPFQDQARRLLGKGKKSQYQVIQWLQEWQRKQLAEPGDYLEFGCYKGDSAVQFYQALHEFYGALIPKDRFHMYLFDSFVGLPESSHHADQHPQWKEGVFDVGGAERFKTILLDHDVPEDRFTLIEGFYEQSLKTFDWSKIKRASFVYMDCDYYSSTVLALDAVKDKLDNFTLIYFDDLYSFSGNPKKGQLLAIEEFNQKHKNMGITPCPLLRNAAEGRIYWVWKETD